MLRCLALSSVLLVLAHVAPSGALVPPAGAVVRGGAPPACGRREALVSGGAAAILGWAAGGAGFSSMAFADEAAPAAAPEEAAPAPKRGSVTTKSGLTYTVVKESKVGGKPVVGDLIAIRFKLTVQKSGAVIDDILSSPEPYYYRVGSGQVLPAVEEAVVNMKAGDVWDMEIPPALGFGTKGRQSSPGKPRIAGDAILECKLEMVAVPGKDEEILEQNGISD